MSNQFIWGFHLDLARSVSLHCPKSIAQAVLLAETMELAIKASRRPNQKSSAVGNPAKGPGVQGERGGGRGGYFPGRGRLGRRGGASATGYFDPQACYVCGKGGHLTHDCTQAGHMSGGNPSQVATTQSSVQRGKWGGRRGSWRARFSGLNVIYDDEGYDYPIDGEGSIYISMDIQTVSKTKNTENTENVEKGTKK